MNINTVIQKQKDNLIKKAKSKGIYENFGQKELRMLEDKYINLSDYSQQMDNNRVQLQSFENWCMDYCG